MSRSSVVAVVLAIAMAFTSGATAAETYPTRTVTIVTSEPGGGSDTIARLIAQGISGPLGQAVIVDNRTDPVAGPLVAKAAPDGYTLLVEGSVFWTEPLIRKTLYGPVKDFAPITIAARQPIVLVVRKSLPVNSVSDLIAYAKSHPGRLTYGSAGIGTSTHLSSELFASLADVPMLHVPFKGTGSAMVALLGGEIDLMFSPSASAAAQIRAGLVHALAVGSATPSDVFPNLPTIAASGLPGYAAPGIGTGVWAPAGTPPAIIERLNQLIVHYLQSPEANARLRSLSTDVVADTPVQAADAINAEMTLWQKVIKDRNIHVQ